MSTRVKSFFVVMALLAYAILCRPVSSLALTLDECYKAARENYPLVRQYNLIELSREFTVENAAKGYYPQLSFSASATYQSDVTELPFDIDGVDFGLDKDQYQLVLELQQTVWDGGAIKSEKEQVRAQSDADSRQLDVTMYALNNSVNQLYFGILLIDAQIEQNRLLQELLARNHSQVAAYLEQGVANRADLDAVEVEQIEAAQTEGELHVNRRAYVDVLALLTGLKLTADVFLVKPLGEVPTVGGNNRPELALYDAQRRQIKVKEKGLTAQYMPRLGVFAQSAYGDPGLDILKGGFEFYCVAGIKLSWTIDGLYTRHNDKRLLDLNRSDIDVEEAAFLLNNRMEEAQHSRTVERLEMLMENDDEIIRLRTSIRQSAEAKVANGTLSVTEMLREVTAEDQARQAKAIHEVQRLQAIYDIKYTVNL